MKEIGGYIEIDRYSLPLLHEGAIALNCGRNALAYLIQARHIKKILIPKFMCDSVQKVCEREGVQFRYYSVGINFIPQQIDLEDDEWLYIVNYYGQLSNEVLSDFVVRHERVIVDNAQAYFQMPLSHVDTLYSCRKFFGVADGAFLYSDARMDEKLVADESFDRMRYLLGRFERTASEFYGEYVANNELFEKEPVKKMSKLTDNLLRGVCYEMVKRRRTANFEMLHEAFATVNRLELSIPEGAFMYPLYIENGFELRKELQARKIYVPTLWPDVFNVCSESDTEWDMAKNILPIPVDQRYNESEMAYLINTICEFQNTML